jgi:hypothetical protein
VNFGGGPLASAGHEDIFLAKFFAESPVPVLISSFGAALAGDGVHLQWKLESDENISGFNVYRTQADSKSVRIAELSGSVASYIDASIRAGMSYTYLLGVRTGSGEVVSQAATVRIPLASVTLGQNHPNPFNPVTTIEYSVQDRSDVVIGVYNSSGELVTRLNEGPRESGLHRVQWNGRNLAGQLVASGAYFYRLEGSSAPARKMILLK